MASILFTDFLVYVLVLLMMMCIIIALPQSKTVTSANQEPILTLISIRQNRIRTVNSCKFSIPNTKQYRLSYVIPIVSILLSIFLSTFSCLS